jgi:ligand-binding sensor domain-containing protein
VNFAPWLILFMLVLPYFSYAQSYRVQTFGLREGLPQSQVETLVEDALGALWVGTNGGGAARFDGQRFEVINTASGLPGNQVFSFAHDDQNRLWIATDKGVAVYNGLTLTQIPRLQSMSYMLFNLPHNGGMLVSAEDSLYLLSSGPHPINHQQSIAADDPLVHMIVYNDEVYGCGRNGLYRVNLAPTLALEPIVFRRNLLAQRLFLDHHNGLGMVTDGAGIWHLTASDEVIENTHPSIDRSVFDGCCVDRSRCLFATREQGIAVASGREADVHFINMNRGMPRNATKRIFVDRWGNIWVGTNGSGLVKLSELDFSHTRLPLNRSAAPQPIYALASNDTLRFASVGTRGVRRVIDDREAIDPLTATIEAQSKALLLDRDGRLWIGTEGEGLYLRTADTLLHFTGASGVGGSFIKKMVQDQSGAVWVATLGGGITRITETRSKSGALTFSIRVIGAADGLADQRVTALAIDQNETLWYGTRSGHLGALHVDKQGVDHTLIDANRVVPREEVKDLTVDQVGRVYVGLINGQVWRIDGLREQPIQINATHQPYALYALRADGQGNLWLGGADGAYRWVIDPTGAITYDEHFTDEDGFEGLEVCTGAIDVGPDGRVAFGTLDGFSTYQRRNEPLLTAALPPAVRLVRPQLNYRALRDTPQRHFVNDWDAPADTLTLTYTQNNLSFDIEAVHLSYPGSIQYRYRVEGIDSTWRPLNDRNYIPLSNLLPGWYTLRAQACVKGASCAEAPPVTFNILTPYWMTSWFKTLVLIAIASALLLGFGIAILIIRRRAKRRNERLRVERDLLELEQRALRLQMNPHFIFNTLNSIQGLIAREDPRSARMAISRFARLMREILQNAREETILLSEELETLEHYLELAQFTHDNCFEHSIIIDDALLDISVPPLILQPFVENAILHGLVPAGGGQLTIIGRRAPIESHVELIVEDNGVGLVASSSRPQAHQSAGVAVTLDRLKAFAENTDKTGIRFERPETGGTRVVITLIMK